MLSCKEVLAELSSYLDEQVSAAVRVQLEQHLAHCRTCTVIYDSTRKTLRIVTDSDSFDLPAEASEKLARELLARLRSRDGGGPTET